MKYSNLTRSCVLKFSGGHVSPFAALLQSGTAVTWSTKRREIDDETLLQQHVLFALKLDH